MGTLMQTLLGFTLIELMIVVAIIGILAVIAIPSYQHYTEQAHFAEVVAATSPYKTAVALALQQGILPDELDAGMHGIPDQPEPTANLSELTVTDSIITATGTKLAGNATFILSPNTDGTQWTISGSCVALGLCSF